MEDEVVKCCQCSGDIGLYGHVVLRGDVEDSKLMLEDAKDPFNDIAS